MTSLNEQLRIENQLRVRLGEGEPGLLPLLGGFGEDNGFGSPTDPGSRRARQLRAVSAGGSGGGRGGAGGSGTGTPGRFRDALDRLHDRDP